MGKVAIDPEGADETARLLDELGEAIDTARGDAADLDVVFPMLGTWLHQFTVQSLAEKLRTAAAIVRGDDNLPSNWPSVAADYQLTDHVDTADITEALTGYESLELDELKNLLDLAREAEVPATEYAGALEHYWESRALERAGIDRDEWDPSRGADVQRDIIEKVYTYYGDLYGANNNLIWAGMANMIGPSFAAGFFDLAEFKDLADRVNDNAALHSLLDVNPVTKALSGLLAEAAGIGEDELHFYETTFLQMQQDIFFDLAPVHEAYQSGGYEAVEEMYDAGVIGRDVRDAFRKIDQGERTGDTSLVEDGNRALLWREQRDVIDGHYDQMRSHEPSGELVTRFMTLIGAPSIPGAKGYPEVFDDGNIADFEDRWALIEQDTLPTFLELWRNDRERANEIISSPVGDRIDDNRMKERFPPLEWVLDGPPIDISMPDPPGDIIPDLPGIDDILFPPLPF
ncbi:hypothetical protein CLV30_105269 [Haloactinopolyspora alba]|uniref:WXG100 family type VII secretion target n=1 Tax=Haloactinopolyspora alba TaxID=648780 RepID=A0A2P8E5R0_9ACTN|nr:hypothetical protein [Haloactinopolyspora alba]PSL04802.1 hypothetical protein CLV30_105269 [Haloactinopolyspora alba]